MAPRLPPSKLYLIRDMIESQSRTTSQMAEEAGCSKLTIINIRRNLQLFGSVHVPPTWIGRKQTVTPSMIEALWDHLFEKLSLYLDDYLPLERVPEPGHDIHLVTTSSIRRAWSKKTARQQAREQNSNLREFYLHNISDFQSYHLVYVDESGCDKRAGFRRTGWSPLGVVPMQISQFHRDNTSQVTAIHHT